MHKFKDGDYVVTLEERKDYTEPGETDLVLKIKATPQLGMDRDDVAGWIFGLEQRSLAERLKSCIEAGAAWEGYEIITDCDGNTVAYPLAVDGAFFHKRHMNASLKRCGF